MKYIYPFLFALTLFFAPNAIAQTSPTDMPDLKVKSDKEASFKIGVNYLSNNVFMGRADTVSTPTVLPEIKYTFKNGIFISGSAYYIPNRLQNKLDGGNLTAGYDYDINDNLSGGFSFAKMFYNTNSTEIGSSISSTINANLNYNIADIITPAVSVDYNFIKQGFGNDIFVNIGLAHDFAKAGIFGDNDLVIISPTATLNAGTQNFYDAYFVLKKYKLTAKAQGLQTAAEKLIAKRKEQLSKFKPLDFELSAPVEYKLGVLILSFIPTYAIAENKLPPRISKGMVTGNIFYFETGAALKF